MSVYSQPESNIATGHNVPTGTDTRPQDKSLGELFADLTRESSQLVRQEVQLAKVELTQKAARVGKDVGMIAAGGFVAYVGALALVGALIFGLAAAGMKLWLAALIVGVLFAGIGGMLVMQGLAALKHIDPVPRQTVETLKEDQEWLKGNR